MVTSDATKKTLLPSPVVYCLMALTLVLQGESRLQPVKCSRGCQSPPFGAIMVSNREASRMRRGFKGTRALVFTGAEEGTCRSALPG
jgi:hypothetical protein